MTEWDKGAEQLLSIKDVMRALAAIPIEADSGQRIKKFRLPPPRSYDDMRNEVATRLAHPKQPFTARCKLGMSSGERMCAAYTRL